MGCDQGATVAERHSILAACDGFLSPSRISAPTADRVVRKKDTEN